MAARPHRADQHADASVPEGGGPELPAVDLRVDVGGIDARLTPGQTGPVADLAGALAPTLATDAFYDLW